MRKSAAALAVIAVLAGCSTGDAEQSDESTAKALRVTRDDGSLVEFPDRLRAWCGPNSNENNRETLWVLGGDLPELENPVPFWIFSRATEDVERSARLAFPHEEGNHAALFVLDPQQEYELSSMEEGSSGEVVVEEWGCESGDIVRLRIEGRLQSEIHDEESVTPVEGEVEARIGDRVEFPD